MITEIGIEEFRKSGLLWFINRSLHVFGYVIAIDYDGEKPRMFPAKTKFRGFTKKIEDDGFRKLTEHLIADVDRLLEDV